MNTKSSSVKFMIRARNDGRNRARDRLMRIRSVRDILSAVISVQSALEENAADLLFSYVANEVVKANGIVEGMTHAVVDHLGRALRRSFS